MEIDKYAFSVALNVVLALLLLVSLSDMVFYYSHGKAEITEPIDLEGRETIEFCPDCYNTIEGISMVPSFTYRDTLVGYKPTKEELKVGDIIGFEQGDLFKGDIFVLHRIVFIIGDKYVTKGDYNFAIDLWLVDYEDVKYKVSEIKIS